jgi:hypothetical protein
MWHVWTAKLLYVALFFLNKTVYILIRFFKIYVYLNFVSIYSIQTAVMADKMMELHPCQQHDKWLVLMCLLSNKSCGRENIGSPTSKFTVV